MAYDLYCQLIDNVLLSDTYQVKPHQLNFILLEVDSKYGDGIARRVKVLYQANLEKDPPKDHVEVYNAVCTELLSEFTLAKLFMSLYFATKYLSLVQEIEQPSKDELAVLRIRLSDELKFIIKGRTLEPQSNLQGNFWSQPSRSWLPWLMGACGMTVGLLSIITYHQIKTLF